MTSGSDLDRKRASTVAPQGKTIPNARPTPSTRPVLDSPLKYEHRILKMMVIRSSLQEIVDEIGHAIMTLLPGVKAAILLSSRGSGTHHRVFISAGVEENPPSATHVVPIITPKKENIGEIQLFADENTLQNIEYKDIVENFAELVGIAIERIRLEGDLVKSKDDAEVKARAKSELVANVSHEIRTPMNAIVGMTDLVLESTLTDEQRAYLDLVKDSGYQLLSMINDILDFSKIEAGQLKIAPEPLSLNALVEKSLALLSIKADQKGLVFVSKIEEDVPNWVMVDELRISQILNNLLGNAIKFTGFFGGVFLYLFVEEVTNVSAMLHFVVSDTGIGVPKDKQKQIFEAFVQADTSTTRRYGGTGLGLSICKKLVEIMGGTIWVDSIPEVGSAFHVRFPAQLCTSHDSNMRKRRRSSEWKRMTLRLPDFHGESAGPSPRILLAEDNPVNAKLALILLEREGFQVTLVENGKRAIEEIQANMFDLILMDCQMPIMDGLEATALIRQAEKKRGFPPIPIIAMTANVMPGDKEKCLNAGMDDYVAKPIKKTELFKAIDSALGCEVSEV